MLLAKSFHLLAVLANQERRYSDAVDLMKRAQEFGGDENFWYSLVQTLLTAVAEQRRPDAHHQVQMIDGCWIHDCIIYEIIISRIFNVIGQHKFDSCH